MELVCPMPMLIIYWGYLHAHRNGHKLTHPYKLLLAYILFKSLINLLCWFHKRLMVKLISMFFVLHQLMAKLLIDWWLCLPILTKHSLSNGICGALGLLIMIKDLWCNVIYDVLGPILNLRLLNNGHFTWTIYMAYNSPFLVSGQF